MNSTVMNTGAFAIVEFLDSTKKKSCEIVPYSWYKYDDENLLIVPYYPPPYTKKKGSEYRSYVKNLKPPKKSWKYYKAVTIKFAKTYENATKQLENFIKQTPNMKMTSDLETDIEQDGSLSNHQKPSGSNLNISHEKANKNLPQAILHKSKQPLKLGLNEVAHDHNKQQQSKYAVKQTSKKKPTSNSDDDSDSDDNSDESDSIEKNPTDEQSDEDDDEGSNDSQRDQVVYSEGIPLDEVQSERPIHSKKQTTILRDNIPVPQSQKNNKQKGGIFQNISQILTADGTLSKEGCILLFKKLYEIENNQQTFIQMLKDNLSSKSTNNLRPSVNFVPQSLQDEGISLPLNDMEMFDKFNSLLESNEQVQKFVGTIVSSAMSNVSLTRNLKSILVKFLTPTLATQFVAARKRKNVDKTIMTTTYFYNYLRGSIININERRDPKYFSSLDDARIFKALVDVLPTAKTWHNTNSNLAIFRAGNNEQNVQPPNEEQAIEPDPTPTESNPPNPGTLDGAD